MPSTSGSPKERVILGLMTYGPDEGAGARILDLDEFNKHLDYFQQQGYNEVDTARMYVGGKQEAWTRKAGWKKRGLTVATKVYPEEPGMHEPSRLRELLTSSLNELGTDSVDIFYLHAPDRSVPYEHTLAELNKLYQEGRFKRLGLSNYASWEVAELCTIAKERGWVRPRIYQAMYNVITRDIESELIPWSIARGSCGGSGPSLAGCEGYSATLLAIDGSQLYACITCDNWQ